MSTQRVQIFTVDPPTRSVEFILKDGTMVQAQVWEVPSFFRWPKQGEWWTVERNGLYWKLGSRMEDVNAALPVESLTEGEAKVNADVIFTENGSRLAVVAPLVTALPESPEEGHEVYYLTQAMHVAGWQPLRLRYRARNPDGSANSNTYKWEAIGASGHTEYQESPTSIPAGGGLFGPTLVVPLNGDYEVGYGIGAATSGPAGRAQMTQNGTGIGGNNAELQVPASTATSPSMFRLNTLGASGILRMVANNGFATTGTTFYDSWIKLTPRRVG